MSVLSVQLQEYYYFKWMFVRVMFLCVCVCFRYERPWFESLECGDPPALSAPHHRNSCIQVKFVTQ